MTDAVRSACYEARYAHNVRRAVGILDMAAYSDLVSCDEAAAFASHLQGWTGIPQLRAALPLTVENCWSPQETSVRLAWVLDAELPPLRCNAPVFDRRGNQVATPDLLDEESGLVIEYDGSAHLDGQRRRADRNREEALRRHGLHVLTVLAGDAPELPSRLRQARRRARFAAVSRRDWTLSPPTWWIPTDTVESRRALDAHQRARLLRWRRDVG